MDHESKYGYKRKARAKRYFNKEWSLDNILGKTNSQYNSFMTVFEEKPRNLDRK